jgi:hypothetical protein
MIIKPAYLSFPFGGNLPVARIVFSDGNESVPLVTKRQALELGESLLGISLDEFEWFAIKEQIHASELTSKSKELEEFASHFSIQMEDFRREMEKFLKEMKKNEGDGEDWKD